MREKGCIEKSVDVCMQMIEVPNSRNAHQYIGKLLGLFSSCLAATAKRESTTSQQSLLLDSEALLLLSPAERDQIRQIALTVKERQDLERE